MKRFLFTLLLISSGLLALSQNLVLVSGELKQWHNVVLKIDGPLTSEHAATNPFMDYRLNVTFSQGAISFVVPGYYAADGNAAESSDDSGNQWKAHFRPPTTGTWTFAISFRTGPGIAIDNTQIGSVVPLDGFSGSFLVAANNKTAPDLREKGMLEYAGHRYLQFANGEYFLKAGADAPENFLGYYEFDNTFDNGGSSNDLHSTKSYSIDGQTFTTHGDGLHHYDAHVQHWNSGDPTWQGGKGKGIIGAINYLSSTGCNAFSFLTMNINGDGREVFPFTTYNSDLTRYDVSKLAQWEIVFSHAESKGMFLHFKLCETENDDLLDGDFDIGPERKLYFREMIARFGHHLALNWNLSEEFGGSNGSLNPFKNAVEDYCQYIRSIDPYNHPIVLHNWAGKENIRFDPHAGNSQALHGISLQQNYTSVHSKTLTYVNMSQNAGYPWIVSNDEQGSASVGVEPDFYNNGNNNQPDIRHHVLWGNLMAGGAGVEYYFGYSRPHDDLECETWQARDSMWRYSKNALTFFRTIPFWQMESNDGLSSSGNYVFTDNDSTYALYIPSGGIAQINTQSGTYAAYWFNPRSGVWDTLGNVSAPGGSYNFGTAPNSTSDDWVFLLKKEPQPVFAINYLHAYADNGSICWETSNDLDYLVIEQRIPEGWTPIYQSLATSDCYKMNDCERSSLRIKAFDLTGEPSYSNLIDLSPEATFIPESGYYVIPCNTSKRIVYQLFDLTGRLVKTGQTINEGNSHKIPVSDLPQGVYTLAIDRIYLRQLISNTK